MGKGMRAGKKKKPVNRNSGANMKNQMAQMAAMQKLMEEAQTEIESMEVSTSSGGGAVNVTVGGDKQIKSIKLNKDVVDPDDVEMLEDLVMTAVNEAMRQIEEKSEERMNMATGSLGLPQGLL